jgi:GNAT superfamily N-acetyltransferase
VQLPGECAPPAGAVLLARTQTQVAGCVLLHPCEAGVAEVKRLYVRPATRGHGIGSALMQAAIHAARNAGCSTLRLETLEAMREAVALYGALGFVEAAPWHPPHTDHDRTRFMKLQL